MKLAGIFLQDMNVTMNQKGDTMKSGMLGTRAKLIHSVGNTGKVRFVPTSNPFSGIFKTGANLGFIRLSSAA